MPRVPGRPTRSPFESARAALTTARVRLDEAEAEVAGARQRAAALERDLAAAARVHSGRAGGVSAELRRDSEKARADERRARASATAARDRVKALAEDYARQADPRTAVTALDDTIPLLLLPVRLETRFRHIDDAGAARDELWVRIYPDDCSVDSFEATLSGTELASGRRYWSESWAAGDEPRERSAWRNLAASHGSGRAAWIISQLQPLNAAAKPTRTAPDEVMLVIATDAPPAAAIRTALATYWAQAWASDGDQARITAAAAALGTTPGVADPEALIAEFAPFNLDTAPTPPAKRSTVALSVAWLTLPAPATLAPKDRSWTEPPRVRLLPDRFVVVGYQGGNVVFEGMGSVIPADLVAGPDPSSPPEEQLRHDADGELVVPEAMRWMVDFDEAVEVGMGIKVTLDPSRVDLDEPIDRVVALGVRLAEDGQKGAERLAELLTHHRYGASGFAVVPQGTPTNNTEPAGAGYSRTDDPDAAWDALQKAPMVPTTNWWKRPDGQWLADALGISPSVFDGVPHALDADLSEARALNRALWPATFGYAMETMLYPVFSPDQVAMTRWFQQHFVTGRGFLPSLRVGQQPYGVLPIAALSRAVAPGGESPGRGSGLEQPRGFPAFLAELMPLLSAVRADWATLAERVAWVGKPGDAHQILLDVIGLHPASVEFHQRYAESLDHLFNSSKFQGIAGQIMSSLRRRELQQDALSLLRRLGYTGDAEPDALEKFFFSHAQRLNGPVVDDRPLSERDPIHPTTVDGHNYIEWFVATARSFEDLRLERGFADDKPPDALLYVLLHHALMLGYWDASLNAHVAADVLTPYAAGVARREPSFVHVRDSDEPSESHFQYLYRSDDQITGVQDLSVADYLGEQIGSGGPTGGLDDQLAALEQLKDVPTARLERCLAEHVDIASHRLDAWLLGMVHYQLATIRYRDHPAQARPGIQIGAYGILEGLRRKTGLTTAAKVPEQLATDFGVGTQADLVVDQGNGGYIFAPSLNQATTAAILRAGYLANATPETPRSLAVNLSSDRVRLALDLIDGIRNGQPLGALLGYRLQRGLHDRRDGLELDVFTYALRKEFPLVADQMASTKSGPNVAIESIEANNVVDGLKLVQRVRETKKRAYPFGLTLPEATEAEAAAISAEVDRLFDAHDALADLALAEGVHQAVLGNYDQVAASLDAYAKGTFPPEPAVIRTPRSGVSLTHRVGLQLEAGIAPGATPITGIPTSPRSTAQAMVNSWLAERLPDPDTVGCLVEWIDPITNTAKTTIVTQRHLQLQPIDLVSIATLDGEAAMSELDDRIVRHVMTTAAPRADAAMTIAHTVALPGKVTFFELAPLVRSLRALLLRSRPLRASDLALAGEAERKFDATEAIARDRVRLVRDAMNTLLTDANNLAAAPTVDGAIDAVGALFVRASQFGLQQVGWGFMYEWRRRTFSDVLARVAEVADRWQERLTLFGQGTTAYTSTSGAMNDHEKFTALGRLDLLVAAAAISPRPLLPNDYRLALPGRRNAMATKRTQLVNILSTTDVRLAPLIAKVKAALPLDGFDPTPFRFDDVDGEVTHFRAELADRVVALRKELAKRIDVADEALGRHDASADPAARVGALQDAGKALLGDDMLLLPEFSLTAQQAAELVNANTASQGGVLTNYLTVQRGVDFPVDDWLHGVARVREKVRELEQTVLLSGVFSLSEPELVPIQLPYRAGEGWFALEFDPAKPPDGERLLYTAVHAVAPNPAAPTCGLLIDEWTEVIPARDETAGLAFHYDRPSSEPPQTWLLATLPPGVKGWDWPILLATIDEALALARLRAVEPEQVETTPYAQFLPATTSAATLYGISIAANLARVNDLEAELMRHD